jgi:hypothetical protein
MPGFFSLEAAKEAMGVVEAVEETIREAETSAVAASPDASFRHIPVETETLWHKTDHLLYLPVLNLTRPRDLYYYQGKGLQALYGFTYKYLTMEHFLGQLTRLKVGYPLADRLANIYAQSQYPGKDPLVIFTDWHVKPHWTKKRSHSSHITMWGRTMPGTKQLVVNGVDGYLLGCWNYQVDTHMTQILVKLEKSLSQTLQHPILCNIFDSEGGGFPTGEAYAAAGGHYLSILSRQHSHALSSFTIEGQWQTVIDDDSREAVYARWRNEDKATADPRQFVLLRPIGKTEPTRIYTGLMPNDLSAAVVPWCHRRRWPNNERRIRDMINGANLNENYGYTYDKVTHRTRQRQWDAAQTQVEVTENKLSQSREAVKNLRQKQKQAQDTYARQRAALETEIVQQCQKIERRQREGKAVKRLQQGLERRRQELEWRTISLQKKQSRLHLQIAGQQERIAELQPQLAQRIQKREAIDTDALCRQRRLEKDQIMLDWQVLLTNLHDWVKQHVFTPAWQKLSLEKATELVYRKPGCVRWHSDHIEIVFDSYRYREHQQAMEATCERFNQANLRWRDGRLLRVSVQKPP